MTSSKKLLKLVIAVCFVFLTKGCPAAATTVRCPPNSVVSSKSLCFNTCDNLNATTCNKPRTSQCHCIEGYVFQSENSQECVPVSSCKVTCPAYMTFRECYKIPVETCNTLGIHPVPSETCTPRCVCIDGYVLSNEDNPQCINKKKCPQLALN
ncbi:von Willebrand factor-like [Bufo bufo]|uniref:von Willebrand factor-like n=1 Tax=Bufo bufo TaxID=8384 RepID=UPI001ABDCEA0|nr:von Willebrand factor-like [Bufo bufo]XP_040277646.1 von Willebrand factor-like [Bufo bufo]XP_040277653.1 von Willebrand factor-like [Bufo bufo]